jgi:hypothetical protein
MKRITSPSFVRAVALVPVVWIFQAIPAAAQSLDVYINEIQVSTSGTDWEFFELQGVPGTDLSSLTLIGVESDLGSSTGRIDRVISLTGQSIPVDGFWLGISPAGTATYGVSGELAIANNSQRRSRQHALGHGRRCHQYPRCRRRRFRLRRGIGRAGRLIPALRHLSLPGRARRRIRQQHSQFFDAGWDSRPE